MILNLIVIGIALLLAFAGGRQSAQNNQNEEALNNAIDFNKHRQDVMSTDRSDRIERLRKSAL